MFKVVVVAKSFAMEKDTETNEGNSESTRRWVESYNSRHKSVNTTRGNASRSTLSLSTWHERLRHQNISQVKKTLRNLNIDFNGKEKFFCEACIYGKHHRGTFIRSESRAETAGELVHTDVCGPMQEKSIEGARYFLLFKDDFSNFRTVYFLKESQKFVNKLKIISV